MKDQASHPQDDVIRARARQAFESSVAGLDQATGNRLRLMRREAIAASRPQTRAWALPLAAAAVAFFALGLAWRGISPPTPAAPESTGNAEVVPAAEFPSEEDADLYAWLGEAPVAPAKGEAL